MNIVNRQIPQLVYDKLQTLNYKHKEHLYIICDMIIRVGSIRRTHNQWNDFIDIPISYIKNIITDDTSYTNAISFLINNNIIDCDHSYSKDKGKAKGYRINKNYISLLISIELTKITLSRKIINNRNKSYEEVESGLIKSRDFYYNNLSIRYKEAIEWVDKWFYYELINLNNNYNSILCCGKINNEYDKQYKKLTIQNCYYITQIENIHNKEFYYKRNNTNNRLDTNLTNLKSELKQFINIPSLSQIDISNSQPYFLYLTILNTINYNSILCCGKFQTTNGVEINKNELDMYGQWVSEGVFYENFINFNFPQHKIELYNINNLDRKQVKEIMFSILFSQNDSFLDLKELFKCIFPTIYNWIYEYKKEKYNILSIDLQKVESEMSIDIISQELDKLNINYFTIHDAWVIDKKHIEKVKEIIKSCFYKKYKNIPTLKTEKITN